MFDQYLTYFLQDPLVSITCWLVFATWLIGERRRLGW